MMDSLSVKIELDLSKEQDRQLIEIISRVKAIQAQGGTPSIVGAAAIATESPLPNTQAIREAGQQISEANQALADVLPGEKRKLTYKERSQVAARARWARDKARKEGKPLPPTAKELKKKERSSSDGLDYSQAEQQSLNDFEQIESPAFDDRSLSLRGNQVIAALMDTSHLPFPDGREIMDGSWTDRPEFNGGENETSDDFENPLDDDYVRSVHEQAARYDKD